MRRRGGGNGIGVRNVARTSQLKGSDAIFVRVPSSYQVVGTGGEAVATRHASGHGVVTSPNLAREPEGTFQSESTTGQALHCSMFVLLVMQSPAVVGCFSTDIDSRFGFDF